MYKVCIIGESGHFKHAISRSVDSDTFTITAVSAGPEHKGCDSLLSKIKHTTPVPYANYTEMLDTEKPDIVLVNPYFLHNAGVSAHCLKRGIHVLSEKPAATTQGDLSLLRQVYQNCEAVYSAMLDLRLNPAAAAVSSLIKAGGIGEIRMISAQKSCKLTNRGELYRNVELYGGAILWAGIHAIDWISWVTGKRFIKTFATKSSIANNGQGDLESTAVCTFVLEKEVTATITLDYLRPSAAQRYSDNRLRVVGSAGIAELRDGKAFVIDNKGERLLPPCPPIYMFDEFIKAVKGVDNVMPTAKEVFNATEICLQASRSARTGEVVEL